MRTGVLSCFGRRRQTTVPLPCAPTELRQPDDSGRHVRWPQSGGRRGHPGQCRYRVGRGGPLMGFIGKGLFEGMVVTARNFVGSYFDKERMVTVQYPEERVQVPENSRTFPFLVFDKDSDPVASMRCVACKICEVE